MEIEFASFYYSIVNVNNFVNSFSFKFIFLIQAFHTFMTCIHKNLEQIKMTLRK